MIKSWQEISFWHSADQKLSILRAHWVDVIVADFDRTITETDSSTSPSVVRDLIRLGRADLTAPLDESYLAASELLFDTYHPIEVDTALSPAARYAACDEWWTKHFELFIKYGTRSDIFERMFADRQARELLRLRAGMTRLIEKSRAARRPFVIFSAGIGNIIEACLMAYGLPMDNVEIIANGFEFESDGIFRGRFRNTDMIHTFSKNERHLAGLDSLALASRSRIVLFGDSVGDASMIENKEGRTVLRVGICEKQDEATRGHYREAFDIVLSPSEVDEFCDGVIAPLLQK